MIFHHVLENIAKVFAPVALFLEKSIDIEGLLGELSLLVDSLGAL